MILNGNISHFTCLFLLAGCCILGCSKFEKRTTEQPLAHVDNKFLYPSEIKEIFPANLGKNDSILILQNFIDKWIKKQLLLQKAELNLTDEQKDVSKQIEEYRSSLLIYKYEQSLIAQKLDTVITPEEIEDYYNDNSSNFILDRNIAKAVFIKLPSNAPNLDRIRQLYRSEEKEDLQQLESYCYQYALKYDYFDDKWIDLAGILNQLPDEVSNTERNLRYNHYIEQQDSLYHYFLNIRDYRLISSYAPVEFVEVKIKSIILNKRKVQFINDLENNIFNDALKKGNFTVY